MGKRRGEGNEGTLSLVLGRFATCYDAYRPFWREWRQNAAYIRGKQHIEAANDVWLTGVEPEDPQMPQLTLNGIKPIVDTSVAKIVPQEFIPQTDPNGLSQEAQRRAAGQDRLLLETSRRVKLTDLLRRATEDLFATDRAIIKTVWVPIDAEAPQVTFNLNDVTAWGGYIHCYTVHPLRFLLPPWATSTDIPWCIEVHAYHKDRMAREFGHMTDTSWSGARSVTGNPVASAGLPIEIDQHPQFLRDMYVVYEMYERQDKEGKPPFRLVKCTDSMVLYDSNDDPNPVPIVELPYSFVFIGDGSNGLMSDGIVKTARVPQDELNDAASLLVKRLKAYLDPAILVPSDAKPIESWQGGKAIQLGPSENIPRRMDEPAVPQEAFQAVGLMQGFIQQMMGANDAMQGKAPKNVSSGVGLRTLIASDELNLSKPASVVQDLAKQTWRRMVVEYKLNVTSPAAALTYIDRSQEADVAEFFLSNLTNMDAEVKPIGGYLQDPESFRQRQLQAIQLGIITDEEEKRDALGLPSAGNLHDAEIWHARSENAAMVAGVPVGVLFYEYHAVHARVHRLWLLGKEARELAQTEEGQYAIQRVEAHLMQHMRYLQASQMPAQPGTETAGDGTGGGMVNPSIQGAPPEMTTTDAGGQQTEFYTRQ